MRGPNRANRGASVTLDLEGKDLYGAMEVRLETQSPITGSMTVTSPTTATATFEIANYVPTGTYAITIRNPGGCEAKLVSALTVDPS